MKRYVAETTSSGIEVLVQHGDDPGDTTPLNRSVWTAADFEWGYDGAGPAAWHTQF